MSKTPAGTPKEDQLRAAVYARLSETYDAAESVPTQLERGQRHAERRGDRLVATFKDDGYSGYKEITRDDFVNLVTSIERGEIDVVIVRDIDRLTRNLEDWNRFEKACVRHGVILSSYTGGDLDLSTPDGAYYGGMETLRARRESAVKSARVREAVDRNARQGKRTGGGKRPFGYARIYVDPNETNPRKRRILHEELHPKEAKLIHEMVRRVLDYGEQVGSVLKDWSERGVKSTQGKPLRTTGMVEILTSPRIAGLREWEGEKYPTKDWPAIIDVETHERLCKLLLDPSRKRDVSRHQSHLLSGCLICPLCEHRMYYSPVKRGRSDSYRCVTGPGRGCGKVSVKADILEEYVTGAVLAAWESPRINEALSVRDDNTDSRASLRAKIKDTEERRDEARRDYARRIIDRNDWLEIRRETEDEITRLRREYDRLSDSGVVLGDIPPTDTVRTAWKEWNIDRKRAAIRAVLHPIVIKPLPSGMSTNPAGKIKDKKKRREIELTVLEKRIDFDWRL